MRQLNHCNQFVEFVDTTFEGTATKRMMPEYYRWLRYLRNTVIDAQKFVVPEDGQVLDDPLSVMKIEGKLRLPFPIVALEYRSTPLKESQKELLEVSACKRIALAWNLNDLGAYTSIKEALGDSLPPFNKDIDAIAVASIFEFNVDNQPIWMAANGALVNLTATRSLAVIGEEEMPIMSHALIEKIGTTCPRMDAGVILADLTMAKNQFIEERKAGGLARNPHDIVERDIQQESTTVMLFMALTSCANVDFDTIKGDEKLNKKRVKNGKLPIFDVRVLMASNKGYLSSGSDSNGGSSDGRTVRTHLRRGHIRRLTSKNIWVNASVINPGGELKQKTYIIKKGGNG